MAAILRGTFSKLFSQRISFVMLIQISLKFVPKYVIVSIGSGNGDWQHTITWCWLRATMMYYLQCHKLTHWGQVMHIFESDLTTIDSDNGLSLGWHQAIFWINAGILLIRTFTNKLQWNLKWNSNIFIQENTFENVVWIMVVILSRTQCVNEKTIFLTFLLFWVVGHGVGNLCPVEGDGMETKHAGKTQLRSTWARRMSLRDFSQTDHNPERNKHISGLITTQCLYTDFAKKKSCRVIRNGWLYTL